LGNDIPIGILSCNFCKPNKVYLFISHPEQLAEYEFSLDYLIVDVLYENDDPQSYRQLKRNLERYSKTGKKISFDTYHRHIHSLLKSGLLKKKKIGNRVILSLEETYKAKLSDGQSIDSSGHFPERRGKLVTSLNRRV
jgi:hypothetical protein